ncbi:hypothetical protein [Fimbriiglobus ruber]|uniref:Uncharacterized protein n=1 Tax=Fimbriiglobus ruber TaxID=1908690 RepID=A0A225D5H1_9BACT|nr:hypothetical protein [Fimbriiglobus ruber]OWK36213.1 hypothetical protein FRUB_08776 [Fimbriiglobus ruber]
MRKLIEPDTIDEPVKQFLTGLDISTEPSIVEVNGRRIFIVVRPANADTTYEEPWTDAKAHRRYDLVNKEIGATISPEEAVELAQLNDELDHHISKVAPLPLEHARNILAQLQAQLGPAAGPQ